MILGASYVYYICSVLRSVLYVFSGLGFYGTGCIICFVYF